MKRSTAAFWAVTGLVLACAQNQAAADTCGPTLKTETVATIAGWSGVDAVAETSSGKLIFSDPSTGNSDLARLKLVDPKSHQVTTLQTGLRDVLITSIVPVGDDQFMFQRWGGWSVFDTKGKEKATYNESGTESAFDGGIATMKDGTRLLGSELSRPGDITEFGYQRRTGGLFVMRSPDGSIKRVVIPDGIPSEVTPNTATGDFAAAISPLQYGEVGSSLRLYNAQGEQQTQVDFEPETGLEATRIAATNALPDGSYLVTVNSGEIEKEAKPKRVDRFRHKTYEASIYKTFKPETTRLYRVYPDGHKKVLATHDGELISNVDVHYDPVLGRTQAAFAVGDKRNTRAQPFLLDVDNGGEIAVKPVEHSYAGHVNFLPDGSLAYLEELGSIRKDPYFPKSGPYFRTEKGALAIIDSEGHQVQSQPLAGTTFWTPQLIANGTTLLIRRNPYSATEVGPGQYSEENEPPVVLTAAKFDPIGKMCGASDHKSAADPGAVPAH